METKIITILKKPSKRMFDKEYSNERIFKYVKACLLSKWNYNKTYHYLCAYFNEEDNISLEIKSGNSHIVLRENSVIVKDISFISEIQKEYKETGIFNEAKLKYLLTDEKK